MIRSCRRRRSVEAKLDWSVVAVSGSARGGKGWTSLCGAGENESSRWLVSGLDFGERDASQVELNIVVVLEGIGEVAPLVRTDEMAEAYGRMSGTQTMGALVSVMASIGCLASGTGGGSLAVAVRGGIHGRGVRYRHARSYMVCRAEGK